MEYVSGGDLMLHIQRKQFSLRQAKFYAAEVLLALEYFHTNNIIYRYASSCPLGYLTYHGPFTGISNSTTFSSLSMVISKSLITVYVKKRWVMGRQLALSVAPPNSWRQKYVYYLDAQPRLPYHW